MGATQASRHAVMLNGVTSCAYDNGSTLHLLTTKLLEDYEHGRVSQAVALHPSQEDTDWQCTMRLYPPHFTKVRPSISIHENVAPFSSMAVTCPRNRYQSLCESWPPPFRKVAAVSE